MHDPGSAVFRYGVAVLSVAVAIGARLLLDPWLGHHYPFATVFFAVLVTAWFACRRASLLAAALGAVGSAYLLLEPRGSFALGSFDEAMGLGLYLAMSVPTALLAGSMQHARRQAETHAVELEARVAERTEELERSSRAAQANEALLLTVAHKAGVGLSLIDERKTYLFANAQLLRFLGLRADQVVGRPVAEVLPDLFDQLLSPRLERALAGERQRYDVERPPLDTHGPPRIYSVSYEPWTDAAGARYAVVMIDDVTESRHDEEALRRREEWFRTLAESMPQMVWTATRKGGVDYCNRRWTEYTGLADDRYLDRAWQEVLHPEDRAPSAERWLHAVASGEPYETEYRLRRADGAYRWHLARAVAMRDAAGRVERWLGTSTDIDGQKRSQELLEALMDSLPGVCGMLDQAGRYLKWNHGLEEVTGLDAATLDGMEAGDLLDPDDRDLLRRSVAEVMTRGRHSAEVRVRAAGGGTIPFYFTGVRVGDPGQEGLVFNGVDVSERKRLEEQLRWAQRLEATGQLAGGVAHDFNNLLTVIGGYSEQLLRFLAADDRCRPMVFEIQKAGERAADLTRQLLAFSRQQLIEPRVLDLNTVVVQAEKMLRRLIGEDVRLITALEPDLPPVCVDPGQIEQIILNLAVNARDAMPEGGRLILATSRVERGPAAPGAAAPEPGDGAPPAGLYVRLTMTDTGSGMTPEVRAHIFEPFYTTKGAGRGTGLGLAVVDGIVRQSGGHIAVESTPGKGTTFSVDLPAVALSITATGEHLVHFAGSAGGSETILLVEDEEEVRRLVARTLEAFGYLVLQAACGKEALAVAEAHPGTLDLLLTDVVMPELNGRRLSELLHAQRPDLKVLFVSGYTDDAVLRHGVRTAEVAFLQKPFTPTALARKVREVLDG